MPLARSALRPLSICVVCSLATAASALAVDNSAPDPLAGPRVIEGARPASGIIEREFDGSLRKHDDPALAAIAKLNLDSQSMATVDRILTERAQIADTIVRDNITLLLKLDTVGKSDNLDERRKVLGEALAKARPLIHRGPLIEEITRALPSDQAKQFRAMIDDYRAALAADNAKTGMRSSGSPGGTTPAKPSRIGMAIAGNLEGFGAELRRSVDRVIQQPGRDFDALIKKLQLTPEQESKVRSKVLDIAQQPGYRSSKLQQTKVFLEIYGMLDTAQRALLVEHIRAEDLDSKRSPRRPRPASAPIADAPGMPEGSSMPAAAPATPSASPRP